MPWSPSQIAVALIGVLHILFALGELLPWGSPFIMNMVLGKWPRKLDLSENDRYVLAMVVHNAGIYNAIVAAGLFATLVVGSAVYPVQIALMSGGIIAGVFGAGTLSKGTLLQAALGGLALGTVVYFQGR